jgi:hypothetical protein
VGNACGGLEKNTMSQGVSSIKVPKATIQLAVKI